MKHLLPGDKVWIYLGISRKHPLGFCRGEVITNMLTWSGIVYIVMTPDGIRHVKRRWLYCVLY